MYIHYGSAPCFLNFLNVSLAIGVGAQDDTVVSNLFQLELAQEVGISFIALAIHNEDSIGIVPEATRVVRVSPLVGARVLDIESTLWLILPDYLPSVQIFLTISVFKCVVLGILRPLTV